MTTTPVLELIDVRAGYGRIDVLHGVTLKIPKGTVMALLGPNGAGKSTTVPSLLILDEISMGLAPLIVAELYEQVAVLKEQGIAILLVEQFAETALRVADYAAIMAHGRITRIGLPDEIHAALSGAYLGG